LAEYQLSQFICDMTWMVSTVTEDAEQVVEAERLVGRLVKGTAWLPPESYGPVSEGYARYSLYCDPENRFEVVVLVWKPGQSTPLHDHDGTWGAEGVVKGRLQVTGFEQVSETADGQISLADLGTVVVNEHGTGQLLPPADCHIVACYGEETAVTVHVYGKQLRQFRVFNQLEETGLYSIRTQQVNTVYEDFGWFL
jgi:predicted metal-dependent enzyme (double-stranded beta helix superfamily)